MRPLAIALAAALLLAGCADDDGKPTSTPAPTPTAPLGLAPAEDTNLTPEPAVTTTQYEGQWGLGWSAGGQENTAIGTAWPTHEAIGNVTGVVITMEWAPSSPASDRLRLIVDHEDDARAGVSGTSPLTLVFEGESAAGQYSMAAVAADQPGAYAAQEMTFTVTVVTDGPFDPAGLAP